jgi:hypothetical protein
MSESQTARKTDCGNPRAYDVGLCSYPECGCPDVPATFGGHSASEVAELCSMLATSADQHRLNYTETAAIARRAANAIRHLLGEDVSNADAI